MFVEFTTVKKVHPFILALSLGVLKEVTILFWLIYTVGITTQLALSRCVEDLNESVCLGSGDLDY